MVIGCVEELERGREGGWTWLPHYNGMVGSYRALGNKEKAGLVCSRILLVNHCHEVSVN